MNSNYMRLIILLSIFQSILVNAEIESSKSTLSEELDPLHDTENSEHSIKDQEKRTIFNTALKNVAWVKHTAIKPSGAKYVLGYGPIDLKLKPVLRPIVTKGYHYNRPRIQLQIKRPVIHIPHIKHVVETTGWNPVSIVKPVHAAVPVHVVKPAKPVHIDHVHVDPGTHVDHVHLNPVPHIDHVHTPPVVHVDHIQPVHIKDHIHHVTTGHIDHLHHVAAPQTVHAGAVHSPFIPSAQLFEVTKPDLGVLPLGSAFPTTALKEIPAPQLVQHPVHHIHAHPVSQIAPVSFPIAPAPLPIGPSPIPFIPPQIQIGPTHIPVAPAPVPIAPAPVPLPPVHNIHSVHLPVTHLHPVDHIHSFNPVYPVGHVEPIGQLHQDHIHPFGHFHTHPVGQVHVHGDHHHHPVPIDQHLHQDHIHPLGNFHPVSQVHAHGDHHHPVPIDQQHQDHIHPLGHFQHPHPVGQVHAYGDHHHPVGHLHPVGISQPGTQIEYHGAHFLNSLGPEQPPTQQLLPNHYHLQYPQIQQHQSPSNEIPNGGNGVYPNQQYLPQDLGGGQNEQSPQFNGYPNQFQPEPNIQDHYPDVQEQYPNTQNENRYQLAHQVSNQQFIREGQFQIGTQNEDQGYSYPQPSNRFIQPGQTDLQFPLHLPNHPGFNRDYEQDNHQEASQQHERSFKPSIQLEPPFKK